MLNFIAIAYIVEGAQWLSGRVLDSRPEGRGPRVRASPATLRCGP